MRAISAARYPWQTSYYPIPKDLYTLNLSLHSSYYQFSPKTHSINKSVLSLVTNGCTNEQESQRKNPRIHQDPCEKAQSFFDEFYSSIGTSKSQKIEDLETEDIDLISRSSSSSSLGICMGWAELKAALGQRINLEGIACSVGVFARDKHLVIPHVFVPDIRYINWAELKRRGFNGVVFDKDNTLTVPYSLNLWPPLGSSIEECKSHFGNNVAVFSNSAGLYEYDLNDKKASALENAIGIKVIRHGAKKPAGTADEIEKHFSCESSKLIMVGDRPFTDVVFGNRNGFLTILTEPLSLDEEPLTVKQVRKLEVALLNKWVRDGVKPSSHDLLPVVQQCVKDQPL